MKRLIAPTLLLLTVVVVIVGCSRIVTGGYENSPDGKHRLWIRQFGPYNHALIQRTTVRIGLVEIIGDKDSWNEKPLFMKRYRFSSPRVVLKTFWDEQGNLSIIVYDYGSYEAEKTHAASNYIGTLSFILDKQTGMFQEKQ